MPAAADRGTDRFRLPIYVSLGAAILAFVAVIGLTGSVLVSITASRVNSRLEEAQLGLSDLLSLMVDVETGVRGFAVTGNDIFLQPYNEALPRIFPVFNRLGQAVGAKDAGNIARLKTRIEENLEIRAQFLAPERHSGIEALRQAIARGEGKRRMDAFRAEVARLRASLSEDSARAEERVRAWNAGSAVLAVLASVGVSLLLGLAGIARRQGLVITLDEAKSEHRRTQDLSPHAPWTADPRGRLTDMGRRWHEWTGMAREETLGEGWKAALHPDELTQMTGAYAHAIQTGERLDIEHRIRMADGTFKWVRSSAVPFNENEGVQGWYGATEDISDRMGAQMSARDMQAELLHATRLSAVGEVAATLAHELAQPLSSISNYVEAVQTLIRRRDPALLTRAEHGLDAALQETVRTAEIVRSLRRFLRGEDKEAPHELLELSPLVKKAVDFGLTGIRQQGLTLQCNLAAGLQVEGNAIRLEQVIANLVRNAAEAMARSQPRILTVTTRAGRMSGSSTVSEVLIADTGPGLPSTPDFDVFQPFSTTKPDGMGLGLPLARRIAEEHGGQLKASAHDGGGTVFCLTLPSAESVGGSS